MGDVIRLGGGAVYEVNIDPNLESPTLDPRLSQDFPGGFIAAAEEER